MSNTIGNLVDRVYREYLEPVDKVESYSYLSSGINDSVNSITYDGNLFSIEEVGIYKPNSKVYDIPVQKYQIEKNEIAFLSANTWDVSGGGNYGYQSIWVNRNNNIFDNLDYEPQNQIKNLSELLNLI